MTRYRVAFVIISQGCLSLDKFSLVLLFALSVPSTSSVFCSFYVFCSLSVVYTSPALFVSSVAYLLYLCLYLSRLLHLHLFSSMTRLLFVPCPLRLYLLWLTLSTSSMTYLLSVPRLSALSAFYPLYLIYYLYLICYVYIFYSLLYLHLVWLVCCLCLGRLLRLCLLSSTACLLSMPHLICLRFPWLAPSTSSMICLLSVLGLSTSFASSIFYSLSTVCVSSTPSTFSVTCFIYVFCD